MKKLLLICLGFIALHTNAIDPTQGPLQNSLALCNYGYNSDPRCRASTAQRSNQTAYTPPSNSLMFFDQYGAIAFVNFDDGNGSHYKYISSSKKEVTEDAAIEKALKICNQESKAFRKKNKTTCKAFYKYSNGCVALAAGKNPTSGQETLFTMVSKNKSTVEQEAIKGCQKSNLKNCHIIKPVECSLGEIRSVINGQFRSREVLDGEMLHGIVPE